MHQLTPLIVVDIQNTILINRFLQRFEYFKGATPFAVLKLQSKIK